MTDLTELDGVAEGRASNLKEAGYESVEDLPDADAAAMAEDVSYLPEDTALELVVQAQNIVAEEDAEVEEEEPSTITEELEEERGEPVEPEDLLEEESGDADSGEPVSADEALEELPDDEELEEEVEELEEEVEEESGEPDSASENEPETEEISFSLSFDDDLEYDTFFDAVMSERASLLRTNRTGVETFEHTLDRVRQGGPDATIELSLEKDALNNLHNCVRQQITNYKGDNLIDHMDALKAVMVQIDEVRSEELF